MYPLFRHTEKTKAAYCLLGEALEQKLVEITEISEGGSVPELKVKNLSAKSVLLLDGEELLGAKQNRILNVSVMVPASKTITVPVSCVEAGRWQHTSYNFASADRTHYAEGRARKARQVNETMRSRGSRRGNQREVWSDISFKAERMKARSQTSASDTIFRKHRASLNEYLNAFSPLPQQVGAVFSIGGITAGVDIFDSGNAMSGSFKKLMKSYALDAIDHEISGQTEIKPFNVKKFLERIGNAPEETYEAVGEGQDVRFDNAEVTGGALVVDGRIIHLCAFDMVNEKYKRSRRQNSARGFVRRNGR